MNHTGQEDDNKPVSDGDEMSRPSDQLDSSELKSQNITKTEMTDSDDNEADKSGDDQNTTNDPVIEDDKSGERQTSPPREPEEMPDSANGNTNGSSSFDEVDESDPIPSGTGAVSRDCSVSDLVGWTEVLPKWHSKLDHRPKGLNLLVRNGIPEPLRGEVWQLLSGAQQYSNLMDQYRLYLTKTAPTEQIILRDVHRTYPAHENFRSDSGSNSLLDSLFKVCKAYAVYDEEVGYCQGLSFLVAALLLHMPEEQAFCVFVCIMQHYGLRDLFRNNFDELYLKFYQLERLLEEHIPDLHQHFAKIGIEPFTYASQWFLTVFTAKFPLNAVFYIMDIFLLDGMDTIFQIALALLRASKDQLLASDFEGVLKYFRVHMPKLYRDQGNVQRMIVASAGISVKRLKKHAKSYEAMKLKERLLENPVTRLQRENAKLTENNLRLEQENDDLARDLVASKIQLRAQLDALEDKADTLDRALTYSRQDCHTYRNTISDMEDERARLEVEVSQLKEVCRRELQRAESEQVRDGRIIADYKKITSQLSKRLDYRHELTRKFVDITKDLLRDNDVNRDCLEVYCSRSSEFLESLEDMASVASAPSQGNSPMSKGDRETRQASIESDPANRPIGAYLKTTLESHATSDEAKIEQLTQHVDELEVELARTKLALVEAECKCQQLAHDMNLGASVTTGVKSATPNSLLNKVVSMSAAMSSLSRNQNQTRSTVTSSSGSTNSGFAKINHIISERVSVLGHNQASVIAKTQRAKSTPLVPDMATNNLASGAAHISPSSLAETGQAVVNNRIISKLSDTSNEGDRHC